MASFHEQGSTNSEVDTKPAASRAIAERRKAALAEVDNAKFSWVSHVFSFYQSWSSFLPAGSMPKSASSPV